MTLKAENLFPEVDDSTGVLGEFSVWGKDGSTLGKRNTAKALSPSVPGATAQG